MLLELSSSICHFIAFYFSIYGVFMSLSAVKALIVPSFLGPGTASVAARTDYPCGSHGNRRGEAPVLFQQYSDRINRRVRLVKRLSALRVYE